MTIGRDVAARVIAKHRTDDLKQIVQAEGLVIRTRHPWRVRFEDAFVYPVIYVPRHLRSAPFRSRVAHCLGHHFMHAGNQIWLKGWDSIWAVKDERQADDFAAWLLMPESETELIGGMSVQEVGRAYRVDEGLAFRRVGFIRH